MARKKSYFSKAGQKNPAGTLLNNMIASSQQRARENAKAEAVAAREAASIEREEKRQLREEESERRRATRETERERKEQIKVERQIEKDAKVDAKVSEKKEKLKNRLELEFLNAKIPHNDLIIHNIVQKAYETDVTPAQLKKTFIDHNMEEYTKVSLREIFNSYVPVDSSLEVQFESHINHFCSELPIDLIKIKDSPEWCEFIVVCEQKNKRIEKERVRISELMRIKNNNDIFPEDLENLWQNTVTEDWSGEELLSSQMFLDFKELKNKYKMDIKNRIKVFMET